MSVFEDTLMKDEAYRKLLESLPEDERKPIIEALRKFVEDFENNILKPLEKLK
jgi:hypothetical protein